MSLQVAFNVAYPHVKFCMLQAVSDLDKGWTFGPKEAHSKLAQLKQKGSKLEVSHVSH